MSSSGLPKRRVVVAASNATTNVSNSVAIDLSGAAASPNSSKEKQFHKNNPQQKQNHHDINYHDGNDKNDKRPRRTIVLVSSIKRKLVNLTCRHQNFLGNSSANNCLARYAILAVATALAYSPTLQNDFVWDDRIFNDAKQVQEFDGIWDIWTKPGTIPREVHYWPMVYTSFWIDQRLFGGNNPVASHVVNVAIHIINSCLVDVALKRIGLSTNAAYLSAIVFALHPVHVESVAWAIERKDTLSALLYFVALLLHPSVSLEQFNPKSCKAVRAATISLILYAFSVLTKSITVSLSAVLLLIPWFIRGNIRRCEFVYSVPFFVIGLAIAVYDIAQMGQLQKFDFGYTFIQRIMIASRAVCFYLWKVVFPTNLSMIYPLWALPREKLVWWSSVVVVASSLLGLFFMRNRWGRGPLTGLLFFGMTAGPTLGLIDYSYMLYSFVADRYQYLAMLGPIAVISSLIVHACGKVGGMILPLDSSKKTKEKMPSRLLVLGCLLGLALGLSTHRQCYAYRNDENFFGYTVRQYDNMNGWYHLAIHYAENKPEESVHAYTRALQILNQHKEEVPDQLYQQIAPIMYKNAGHTLTSTLKQPEEAVELLEEAVKHLPSSSKLRQELGFAFSGAGKEDEALKQYRLAVSINPRYSTAFGNMGNSYLRLGREKEGEDALKKALELGSQSINFRMNLATAYNQQGKQISAVKEYETILKIDPNNVVAKERLKKSQEMVAKYMEKKAQGGKVGLQKPQS